LNVVLVCGTRYLGLAAPDSEFARMKAAYFFEGSRWRAPGVKFYGRLKAWSPTHS
jgi:hypothetical protein